MYNFLTIFMPILLISVGYGIYGGIGAFITTTICVIFLFFYKYPSLCTVRAKRHYAAKDYERAFRNFEKVANKKRTSVADKAMYGYCLLMQGYVEKAEFIFNRILDSDKKMSIKNKLLIYQNQALVEFKKGDLQKAHDILDNMVVDYPNSTIYGTLGYFKIALARQEAEEFCFQAFAYDNTDKMIVDNLVNVYYRNGNYIKAKEYAQLNLASSPEMIECYYHAAQVEEALGNMEIAKEYFLIAKQTRRKALTTISIEQVDNAYENILNRTGLSDANQLEDSERDE